MGNGVDLLRMLEPAVRPVTPVSSSGSPPKVRPDAVPIESRSFDELLDQARQMTTTAPEGGADEQGSGAVGELRGRVGAMADLVRVDRIENDSLRILIGGKQAM